MVVTVLSLSAYLGRNFTVTFVDDYNRTSIVYFTHFPARGLSLNTMKNHKVWNKLMILMPTMKRFTLLWGYVVHKFDYLITGILIIRLFQKVN